MPTPPCQSRRPTTCKRSLKRKRYRTRCRFMAERVMASMARTGRMLAAAPWLSCRGTSHTPRSNDPSSAFDLGEKTTGEDARRSTDIGSRELYPAFVIPFLKCATRQVVRRNFFAWPAVHYTEDATEVSNVRISGLVPSVRDLLAAGTACIGGLPICVADSVAVPHSWDRRAWRACPGCGRDHASSPPSERPLPPVALKAGSRLYLLGSGLSVLCFRIRGAP